MCASRSGDLASHFCCSILRPCDNGSRAGLEFEGLAMPRNGSVSDQGRSMHLADNAAEQMGSRDAPVSTMPWPTLPFPFPHAALFPEHRRLFDLMGLFWPRHGVASRQIRVTWGCRGERWEKGVLGNWPWRDDGASKGPWSRSKRRPTLSGGAGQQGTPRYSGGVQGFGRSGHWTRGLPGCGRCVGQRALT